jgi:amino acid transporter
MRLADFCLGRPLASSEDQKERVGSFAGVSVFGLDALSSAAYGPEAALMVLLPIGLAGAGYSLPILTAVCVILLIVFFSYRQTIAAYPGGAGSYTVAKENLGEHAGLLGAVALMIDYTLNVAVGISAGVGALVSALPVLQNHTLILCLAILAVLLFLNLRGLREAGFAFMPPTYLFVGCLVILIAIGIVKAMSSGGQPQPAIPNLPAPPLQQPITWWLLLKSFAAGCTSMTGIEAVSNGVQAFQEPAVKSAQRTLTLIVTTLVVLVLGVSYLVSSYKIVPAPPGSPHYQTTLSLVTQAVVGRGVFYYLTSGATLLVLCLSANTSFAGFPRLCQKVALDSYLPASFSVRGRRLVFTQGIVFLTVLATALLIAFRGITDSLIPLFAVGAFLAFTLSQAGMVMHWLRSSEPHGRLNAAINGTGAFATAVTFLIVIVTKFTEGAWLVAIVIPALFALMYLIKRHYARVVRDMAASGPLEIGQPPEKIVVVPLDHVNRIAAKALGTAFALSDKVHVLHIRREDSDEGKFWKEWEEHAQVSIKQAGLPKPEIVILNSPFRKVVAPVFDYIWALERDNPHCLIVVLIPQLIESHWIYNFLHNQKAALLTTVLLLKGRNRTVIVNVPWNLEQQHRAKGVNRPEPWDRYPSWLEG